MSTSTATSTKPASEKKTTSTKDGAKGAARGTLKVLGEKVIKVLAESNPKREGTRAYKRFAAYKDGMTVSEYVNKGGTMSALRYDIAHKYIAVA